MTRIGILFIISFAACVAQTDSLLWKQYVRGGGAQAEKDKGVFGYYRLNRQTPFTFRDLRFFGYGLKKESFIYVRYKSSDRSRTLKQFYRYTTTSYRKNTRAGVQLQYHFNQGLGIFVKEYQQGLMNIEIGHAFDVSDYLNAERKTSYVKSGIYWDHDTARFSTKLEVEHFQQISEIIENNLTRNQYMFVLIVPVKNGVSLNLNFEMEDYLDKDQNDASSITFAIGWDGKLKWTL